MPEKAKATKKTEKPQETPQPEPVTPEPAQPQPQPQPQPQYQQPYQQVQYQPQPPHQQPVPPQYGQPQPYGMGMPVQNPGETIGIIGIVLNFLGINVGGIICGVISRNKSREVGASTTLGTVSLVWGIIGTALAFIAVSIFIILIIIGAANS